LAAAANDGLIAATDLADHLAQRGVPFRQAHEIVGRIVRAAEGSGRSLSDFTLDGLRSFSPQFEASAGGRKADEGGRGGNVGGGPAPTQVALQLGASAERIATLRAWLEQTSARLPTLDSVTAAD